jgi:hypothetical protein
VPPRGIQLRQLPGSPTPAMAGGVRAWAAPICLVAFCLPRLMQRPAAVAMRPQRGRHLDVVGRLARRGLRPFAFWPCGPSVGITCSCLHGQCGVPGQLYGLPGGRRCKTSLGFCLDGLYSPPCGGRFFARCSVRPLGGACTSRNKQKESKTKDRLKTIWNWTATPPVNFQLIFNWF